jgi:hypothetical protein
MDGEDYALGYPIVVYNEDVIHCSGYFSQQQNWGWGWGCGEVRALFYMLVQLVCSATLCFLRTDGAKKSIERVPNHSILERILVLLERFFFLKKEHSVFWNAFFFVFLTNISHWVGLLIGGKKKWMKTYKFYKLFFVPFFILSNKILYSFNTHKEKKSLWTYGLSIFPFRHLRLSYFFSFNFYIFVLFTISIFLFDIFPFGV